MTDSLEIKRKRGKKNIPKRKDYLINKIDLILTISKDEKPNRSLIQLARMGMVYFGIEMMFSIEIALTVPILLKLKVSEKFEHFY
jgi:hypothetical protein